MTTFYRKLAAAGLAFCALIVLGTAAAAAAPVPKDANILIITIDTLRYDRLGILSSKYVKTPNIDALARRSVIFTHAYAQSTLTRPSHTNILTGTTPLYHGVSDNPGFKLESRYLTLSKFLADKGYKTGAFIGNFILDARFGLDQGFDLYDDDAGETAFGDFGFVERPADKVIQPAVSWIMGQSNKWFCWIHLFDPHEPYAPPEPFKTEYAKDPYSGEVAFVDAQLGRLFSFLEKSGALDKTIIIITSDHGEAFGEKDEIRHGFFAYNNVLHIPLIIYYPGDDAKVVSENACHVDIFPTVCDLLDVPAPSHLQGESLLPIIAGRERQKKLIYFESLSPHYFLDAAPLTGYLEGNLKYIDQPIKELYDLSTDPLEVRNIANTVDIGRFAKALDTLKKSLKGKGTTQDIEGKSSDIRPLMESLGYLSGKPTKNKVYGIQDDLKSLYPLMAQLRMAIDYFQSGRQDMAVKMLNTILRIRPSYITAYTALADCYYNLKRFDEAVATIKNGLSKNPDNLSLTGHLGETLVMIKKYADAFGPLQEAARRDPNNPDYLNYLGLAFMGTGDLKEAEDKFHAALLIEPDLNPVFNNLGYLYLTLYMKTSEDKYLDDAIENFDRALAEQPDLVSAKKGKEAAVNYKLHRFRES
jgi:arylsulfatase A-like enzyme/Flp pilus assembly protein TadD